MVNIKSKRAYGAILMVLIVGVFLALMSVIFTLQSQSRLKNIDSVYKKAKSLFLAESCAEDIMSRSNNNEDIPDTITLPNGQCEIVYNSHPVFKVIKVTSTVDEFTSVIEISTTLPPGQQGNNGNNGNGNDGDEHGNGNAKFDILYWHQIE